MIKSKNLTSQLILISTIFSIMLLFVFAPIYVQAETDEITVNVLEINYDGSTNNVHCNLEVDAVSATKEAGLIIVSGLSSFRLKKISQFILWLQVINLDGSVTLYSNVNTNMKEMKTVTIDEEFRSGNASFNKTLFTAADFKDGAGEYMMSINLKYSRNYNSSSCNELLKIQFNS